MRNLRMKEALESGECIDVGSIGTIIEDGDMNLIFKLSEFIDGKDYCVKESEDWIWSIGKNKTTGEILASTDTRFYQNSDFECLWLR